MKSILDREALQSRARRSHAASLGGLLAMLASVAVSMWLPVQSTVAVLLLVGGFALAAVGIYAANRWVRKPRPEDVLDHALRGLNDQHRLYHYVLPQDHVLLDPGGLVVIEVVTLEGLFMYREDRWQQRMPMGRALRFFLEEGLGNPTARAQVEARSLANTVAQKLDGAPAIPVDSVVVFTHPNARLEVQGTPVPACSPERLKKNLPLGLPRLPQATYDRLRAWLDSALPPSARSV